MKTLIVLVGPPASGKSSHAEYLVDCGFTRISQDDMGRKEHFVLFTQALERGENITIDRMGFSKEQRSRYITPAKEKGYNVKIITIFVSYDECLERCMKRKGHPTIQDENNAKDALKTFFTKFERPTEDEGELYFYYGPSYETLRYGTSSLKRGYGPSAIWVDIDNTLSNAEHRQHFMQGSKKDWKGFFDAMGEDSVNEWCKAICNAFNGENVKVFLCSARPDNYRKITESWLLHNNIHYDKLIMRHRNDFRPDYIVKEIMLDFEILSTHNLLFSIDDRKQVIDKVRSRGFTVLDCAGEKGAF